MAHIIEILNITELVKNKKPYYLTTALMNDGTEAQAYGKDFNIGDAVEVFFHERYDKVKFRLKNVKEIK